MLINAAVLVVLLAATIGGLIHHLRASRSSVVGTEAPPGKKVIDNPPSESPDEFHDITEIQIADCRFVTSRESDRETLTVYRKADRVVRLTGGQFYLPPCDAEPGLGENVFQVRDKTYLVLGEREAGGSIRGMWHVMQVAPSFRYIQGIQTKPATGCPLFLLPDPYGEADVSLVVVDATMCGFDSDTVDCRLEFTIWYRFVGGEFRPDYSTDGTSTDWEYVRQIGNSTYMETAPVGKIAPVGFWEVILEFVSEGRAEAATSFIEWVWPENSPGRREAMKAFVDRLKTSRHYRGLLRMNRGRMPR